jgi:hypothetical protein
VATQTHFNQIKLSDVKRSMDALMMSLFNSREREVDDWKNIFERAYGDRCLFKATRVKDNPSTGVIVAEWLGDSDA